MPVINQTLGGGLWTVDCGRVHFLVVRAIFMPSPIRTRPVIFCCTFQNVGLRLNNCAVLPSIHATPTRINAPWKSNQVPRTSSWSLREGEVGSTNWGRKDKKKIATFGFSTFVIIPCLSNFILFTLGIFS